MKEGTLVPLGKMVAIRPLAAPERSAGGIYYPDTAKTKPERGKVVAVGPGERNKDGILMPMTVSEGHEVLFDRYSVHEIKWGGEDLVLVSEDRILARIN